jgi:hypothetical protein
MGGVQEKLFSSIGTLLTWTDRVFGTKFIKHHIIYIKGPTVKGDPPLPLLDFISSFHTVLEWLYHICDTYEQTQIDISEYFFILYEGTDFSTLGLFGYNFSVDKDGPIKTMGFTLPPEMYMTLHQQDYCNLAALQLRERIANELKNFTKTTEFNHSFLAKSQTISFNSTGDIWSVN